MKAPTTMDSDHRRADSAMPWAVLRGGPGDIPGKRRELYGQPSDDPKIKLPHRGGYEHFERDYAESGPQGCSAVSTVVYRWTGRTEIAE